VMVTATVGWAGAAATGAGTARMHRATTEGRLALTATGHKADEGGVPEASAKRPGELVRLRNRRRTAHLLLLSAVVTVAVLMAVTSWLRG
jgi:hypothetical protein